MHGAMPLAGEQARHLLDRNVGVALARALCLAQRLRKARAAALPAAATPAGGEALLLGGALPLFVFELIYAYLVAYVLYWLVCLAEGAEYQIVAIMIRAANTE